jgi:hypothetical protein
MATYVELYNMKDHFVRRATIAALKIADYILTVEGAGVENHANRVIWANQAISDPETKARQFLYQILANATVQAAGEAALDSDIQWIVEDKLNGWATGA